MKKLLISLAVIVTVLLSCDKIDEVNNPVILLTDYEMIVNEDATIENALETTDYEVDFFTGSQENLDATFEEVNEGYLKSGNRHRNWLRYLFNQAPEVTIDTAEGGYPIIITLNYGDGTELLNGKVLKGKIIITITAPLREDGSERRVDLEDFYVDSVNIEGYANHVLDIGEDTTTIAFICNRNFSFNFSDGTSIIRQGTKRREWVSGIYTPYDLSDDEIHITGSATSVSRDGIEYHMEITSYLVKLGTCRFIVSGVMEFSVDGELIIILDYGDGRCDNLAIITNDEGVTIVIRIDRFWNMEDHRQGRSRRQNQHQNGNNNNGGL